METGRGPKLNIAADEPCLRRRRLHRFVFLAAGIYNIAWGTWTAVDPQWLFRFAEMAPANYPQIFACLGMVIGLYGILYLEVARRPEHGWLIAAVGLTGKILGPAGLLIEITQHSWPPATIAMCITNDFVWWLPFALYLRDAWPIFCRRRDGHDHAAMK